MSRNRPRPPASSSDLPNHPHRLRISGTRHDGARRQAAAKPLTGLPYALLGFAALLATSSAAACIRSARAVSEPLTATLVAASTCRPKPSVPYEPMFDSSKNISTAAGRRRRPPDRLRHPRRVRPRARRQDRPDLRDPPSPRSPQAAALDDSRGPRRNEARVEAFEQQAGSRRHVAPRGSATQAARRWLSAPLIGRTRAALYARPGCPTKNRRRPTLPGGCPPSTIGAEWLNCSVRNGKRCLPLAMRHRNFARRLGGA